MPEFYQQRFERKGLKGLESYAPCVSVSVAQRRKPIYVGYFTFPKKKARGDLSIRVGKCLLRWRPARDADLGNIWKGPNGKNKSSKPLDKQRRGSQPKRAHTTIKRPT